MAFFSAFGCAPDNAFHREHQGVGATSLWLAATRMAPESKNSRVGVGTAVADPSSLRVREQNP
jgi:hypothetical protein